MKNGQNEQKKSEPCLNRVMLLGRLGKDVEVRFTPDGTQVGTFSLATSRAWKDRAGELQTATEWHRVVTWNCEPIAKFLTKGKRVHIEGRLQTREYEKDGQKRYTTEVVAQRLILLSFDRDNGHEVAHEAEEAGSLGVTDDDVPY